MHIHTYTICSFYGVVEMARLLRQSAPLLQDPSQRLTLVTQVSRGLTPPLASEGTYCTYDIHCFAFFFYSSNDKIVSPYFFSELVIVKQHRVFSHFLFVLGYANFFNLILP